MVNGPDMEDCEDEPEVLIEETYEPQTCAPITMNLDDVFNSY